MENKYREFHPLGSWNQSLSCEYHHPQDTTFPKITKIICDCVSSPTTRNPEIKMVTGDKWIDLLNYFGPLQLTTVKILLVLWCFFVSRCLNVKMNILTGISFIFEIVMVMAEQEREEKCFDGINPQ